MPRITIFLPVVCALAGLAAVRQYKPAASPGNELTLHRLGRRS